jgi:hypothetical protein
MAMCMTNKDKVRFVNKIMKENEITELDVIFYCAGCEGIYNSDIGIFCDLCGVAACDQCSSEKLIENQLCDSCMEKTCCTCDVKMCDSLHRFSCFNTECKEKFCKTCHKNGFQNGNRKHTCCDNVERARKRMEKKRLEKRLK